MARVCWDIREFWRKVYRDAVQSHRADEAATIADTAVMEYVLRAKPLMCAAEAEFLGRIKELDATREPPR